MVIRFLTAFLCGGIVTWGKQQATGNGHGGEENKATIQPGTRMEEELRDRQLEEGKLLLAPAPSSSLSSLQHGLSDKTWLDCYWLAGAATSSYLSGTLHQFLHRPMLAFHPHERLYVFFLVVALGCVADWCFARCHRYHFSKMSNGGSSSRYLRRCDIEASNKHDDRDNNTGSINSRRTSSLQRRKPVTRPESQSSQMIQPRAMALCEIERQAITTCANFSPNENTSDESDQFFDCLDEIELYSASTTSTAALPTPSLVTQSNENEIALYSQRNVTWPDGTPAYVPAGESPSIVPPGYLALFRHNPQNARAGYLQTQEWRREERIHSIHDRQNVWFSKIKASYPHVIHGFARDGTLVIYESPGRMNLKSLFKNGCGVKDMIEHYCYLMEYLSNIEAILTELYSSDGGEMLWQEELAAYANAKQGRLQNDPIKFGFCVVMDIGGASPSLLSVDVLSYLKRAGDVNTSHYPGSMRHVTTVNAPFLASVAWNRIKGLLPRLVTMNLLSRAQTIEGGLLTRIDEDQVPEEYGGKSRFKLGEHPFEVGLQKLVKQQKRSHARVKNLDNEIDLEALSKDNHPEIGGGENVGKTPHNDASPLYLRPSPQLETDHIELKRSSLTSSAGISADPWDGLEVHNILNVVAVLYFLVFVVVGALELALPYWIAIPSAYGGLGCGPQQNGMVLLVSYVIYMWATNRSRRLSRLLARSNIEKCPLMGFRIGIGITCFFLVCVGFIPIILDPTHSILGLLCFSVSLSWISFGGALGILSLEHLRWKVKRQFSMSRHDRVSSLGDDESSKSVSLVSTFGRIVGYVSIAPIFRWSVVVGRKDLYFPFNASFFLCLLACVCWLLYIGSFSLHTAVSASSPPTDYTKQKKSQLGAAMAGCFSFIKEVGVTARSDIIHMCKK